MVAIGYHGAVSRLREMLSYDPEHRLLFITPIVNGLDPDALMLHDGLKRLGDVVPAQSRELKKMLDSFSLSRGQDQVLVAEFPENIDLNDLEWGSSLTLKLIGYVYERPARKLAAALVKHYMLTKE